MIGRSGDQVEGARESHGDLSPVSKRSTITLLRSRELFPSLSRTARDILVFCSRVRVYISLFRTVFFGVAMK